MPLAWLGWAAVAWIGSKAVVNMSEGLENTADAGAKAGAVAALAFGGYLVYKKVSG